MSILLPYSYVSIEGNIGAGKTSLARIFSNRFNTELVLEEFAENTFLPQFYENPERFAFPLEMSFLAERYQQLKQAQESAKEKGSLLISDYIFEKSLLFAQINLSKHELGLFERFYSMIKDTLVRPDLVIYLKKSTNQLLNNIEKRGRDYEKSIPAEYLNKVSDQYLNHLKSLENERILIIESDSINFIDDAQQLLFLADLAGKSYPKGVHFIKP